MRRSMLLKGGTALIHDENDDDVIVVVVVVARKTDILVSGGKIEKLETPLKLETLMVLIAPVNLFRPALLMPTLVVGKRS